MQLSCDSMTLLTGLGRMNTVDSSSPHVQGRCPGTLGGEENEEEEEFVQNRERARRNS